MLVCVFVVLCVHGYLVDWLVACLCVCSIDCVCLLVVGVCVFVCMACCLCVCFVCACLFDCVCRIGWLFVWLCV